VLTRKTVMTIFLKIKKRIAEEYERQSPSRPGEVEVDESYFRRRRVRGKRGRGAGGKTIVFGLLKRDGKVYTEIVPDCKKRTLRAIIRGQVAPGSIIHSDGRRGYDDLVDVLYRKHFRVTHWANEFARGDCHISGIESF
jgi:transposase